MPSPVTLNTSVTSDADTSCRRLVDVTMPETAHYFLIESSPQPRLPTPTVTPAIIVVFFPLLQLPPAPSPAEQHCLGRLLLTTSLWGVATYYVQYHMRP